MDYLKIGRADELSGKDYKLYRILEIFPGFLSWLTLFLLTVLSFVFPVYIAFFIIAFDVYWLLLVLYLGIHLASSYIKMKKNIKFDWQKKCQNLGSIDIKTKSGIKKLNWEDLLQIVIFPAYNESYEVINTSIQSIINGKYPSKNIVLVLTIEERGGLEILENAKKIKEQYKGLFKKFILSIHPDGIEGELKGKGANQAWAAQIIKNDYVDKEKLDYDKILVSVFDIDTIIYPDYFFNLAYRFLTNKNPYRASYQPIPVYHNNVWQAPFFARVAASSNTFWQMMQQIRQEKLATYSSHSMTWQALVDIGFWSKTMVSEDSRIFWHCFCYYKGDYTVEPMYYPVSMDVTMDASFKETAKALYIQQRRWGWGVENLPYLMFNTYKLKGQIPMKKFVGRILVQLYGFHSWATNALIIGVIGWFPLFFGGDSFNSTTLSANLPAITRTLMTLAMSGLVFSAILSTLLLPKKPKHLSVLKYLVMLGQWLFLPLSIIIFGSVPGLEAQSRLMMGKYLGFKVTPKSR